MMIWVDTTAQYQKSKIKQYPEVAQEKENDNNYTFELMSENNLAV